MKIEILFPCCCNLFGDLSNMDYLRKCLPDAEFVETAITDEPVFARERVDMVYLGPMTERTQELVLERLRPYRERIWELITGDTLFLFTGNALELAGEYIVKEDDSRLQCLGIFPIYAKQDMMHRHNSVFLGDFEGQPVMGFKSQFTMAYPLVRENRPVHRGKRGGPEQEMLLRGHPLPEFLWHLSAGAGAAAQPQLYQVSCFPVWEYRPPLWLLSRK